MATTLGCTAFGHVVLAGDAACGVSGHRDGMWQLALLLSSMPARRVVTTAGRGHRAAHLGSGERVHKTR